MNKRDREVWNAIYPPGHPKHYSTFWELCRILGCYFGFAAFLALLWALAGLRYPV